MSDIETVVVDSLKVLDPNRPIREADILNPDSILIGSSASRGKVLLTVSLSASRAISLKNYCLWRPTAVYAMPTGECLRDAVAPNLLPSIARRSQQ